MMAVDWQSLAAAACVALAAIVVVIRAVKLLRGSGGGCATGTCTDCPQSAPEQPQAAAQHLVALDDAPPPVASDGGRLETD